MVHRKSICCAFLVVLFFVVTLPAMAQPATELAPDSLASIPAAMQKFVDSGEISGAVTLVGHKGKIVHLEAVGKADLTSGRPMRKNSLFSIASMTKPIVATGVLILQDDGKLNVSDPVSKYLPDFRSVQLTNGEPANREITIRDVLTHTSGLSGNQIFEGSLADAAAELARRPLAFQPGTRWEYSPGLNVAGRIIEVVSEMPLQDFLAQKIFEPLKMNNTTFYPSPEQIERIATLYEPGSEPGTLTPTRNFIVDYSNVTAPNPSGGLISNARDLFRFYQMVLNRGNWRGQQIVSAEAVRQMTECQTDDLQTGFTPGNCWGLGWCIVREPQGITGMLSPGTFGHGGAFGTQGWVDPKTKTIYVLLIQRTKLPNSDGSTIRHEFQTLAAQSVE